MISYELTWFFIFAEESDGRSKKSGCWTFFDQYPRRLGTLGIALKRVWGYLFDGIGSERNLSGRGSYRLGASSWIDSFRDARTRSYLTREGWASRLRVFLTRDEPMCRSQTLAVRLAL